ncbi:MAG: hypothetical protein IJ011_00530 [Clostridia bacterium]|nr:hypothetical protein [Clostridia bacterium]
MDEFLLVAIIEIILGVVLVIWTVFAEKRRSCLFSGVIIAVLGITIFAVQYLTPDYTENFIIFTVGAVICSIAVNFIVITYSCNERVSATMIDYGFKRYKAHIISSPIFTYRYNGTLYKENAAQSFSGRYVLKHYKEGETYTVYLNKKHPDFFKVTRRIHMFEGIMFLIGFAIMLLSFICE